MRASPADYKSALHCGQAPLLRGCFLSTINHSPFTIHHSLFIIHYSLFIVHCSLFIVHYHLSIPLHLNLQLEHDLLLE